MSSTTRVAALAASLVVVLLAWPVLAQEAAEPGGSPEIPSEEWQAVEKPSPRAVQPAEEAAEPVERAAEPPEAAEPPAGEAAEQAAEPTEEPAEQAAEPSEGEEEDSGNALVEYGSSVANRYLVGLNSLITFPADPVMDTVKPREEFNELPLAAGTKYIAGFGTGVLLSVYRACMGAFDVVFAPLTPMKELSPEPRWMIFPGAEHEEL